MQRPAKPCTPVRFRPRLQNRKVPARTQGSRKLLGPIIGKVNHRDRLKGIFLIAIALAFGLGALNYSIGKVERAGPGFFRSW